MPIGMRVVGFILGAFVLACYIETGALVMRADEAVVHAKCPGHRTGFEKYPWTRPMFVAAWPVAIHNRVVLRGVRLLPISHDLVCDRFD